MLEGPQPQLSSLDFVLCTTESYQMDETGEYNIHSNDCYYYALLKIACHWIINIIFILIYM